MSKSLLKQCHDEISHELVHRKASAGMCCGSNYSTVKKPWLSSNNDPLQDYIRRTLARQVMCRSNERVPVVYSTLSKEKGLESCVETSSRRYFITSGPVRANPVGYHPYLKQKQVKYVLLNRNGFKGVVKNQPSSQQIKTKEETEYKVCSGTDRLDFIEKYITLNTDQFGYVSLNEMILKELGNAIAECLSREVTVSKVICETLYEPISPAGCSEDED